MFTVLRGIIYFAGIIALAFLDLSLLSYVQHMTLGIESVFCFIVAIYLTLLFLVASAKFLEWVITR